MGTEHFPDTSVFIIPIWIEDTDKLKNSLNRNAEWQRILPENLSTDYMLNYVNRIIMNSDYTAYEYVNLDPEKISISVSSGADEIEKSKNLKYETEIHPVELRLSIFETGIAFAEFRVEYRNLKTDEICDFIYDFKKVYKTEKYKMNRKTFYGIVLEAIAGLGIPFFYNPKNKDRTPFKDECIGFHAFRFLEDEIGSDEIEPLLFKLRHGYSSRIQLEADTYNKEFIYKPGDYDYWSGSLEGLVNIVRLDEGNPFVDGLKFLQLMRDYRFMFLFLLNQRFSAMKYIEEVADGNKQMMKSLTSRIVKLKTAYSFRQVSSDLIFQNLYVRIYYLLEIDDIIADMQDNEKQAEMYHEGVVEAMDNRANKLLIAISLLSIFSCLIDSASYFQLFSPFSAAAKWISLVIVACVIICWILYIKRPER